VDGVTIAAAGFAGFGLGVGLLLGAFIVRTLRRYMRDEHIAPYGDDE
jgi:hypothetical protein